MSELIVFAFFYFLCQFITKHIARTHTCTQLLFCCAFWRTTRASFYEPDAPYVVLWL